MKLRLLAAILGELCLLLLQAGEPQPPQAQAPMAPPLPGPVVREGQFWVQTTQGSFPCAVKGQLKVTAQGSVAIRGVSRDDCGFRVRQRTRAASEADARSRMRGYAVRTRTIVETSILTIHPGDASPSYLELDLYVPRTMREAAVVTRIGDVQAFDMEGEVSLESGGGQVVVDRIGGDAILRTAGGQVKVGSVSGDLHCYSGGGFIRVNSAVGETWCDTAGGNISIGLVRGPLHLTTAGGNIIVEKAGSSVNARSVSGLIDIQEAAGIVTAVARGGSIQIGSAQGARCEANGGTIRVKSQGGPIRLSSAVGDILAHLLSARFLENSFVNSDAGDVTVLIPSNVSMSVMAMNESPGYRGRILSDFPEVRIVESGGMSPVRAEGALNGGGPVLRVSTGGGSIFLRRQR
jgi:hypothetical protein